MPYPAAPARLACLLLGSLLSLCACAEAGKTVLQSNAAGTALVSPSTATPDDASQSTLSFAQWREAFRSRALASGLPARRCKTLGVRLFMRVPLPAAMMMMSSAVMR